MEPDDGITEYPDTLLVVYEYVPLASEKVYDDPLIAPESTPLLRFTYHVVPEGNPVSVNATEYSAVLVVASIMLIVPEPSFVTYTYPLLESKELIGTVEQFFDKISVVAITLHGSLKVGDIIEIGTEDESVRQKVASMQIDKNYVEEASSGDSVGIKPNTVWILAVLHTR